MRKSRDPIMEEYELAVSPARIRFQEKRRLIWKNFEERTALVSEEINRHNGTMDEFDSLTRDEFSQLESALAIVLDEYMAVATRACEKVERARRNVSVNVYRGLEQKYA